MNITANTAHAWLIHLRSCLEWPMFFYGGISCSAKLCRGKLPRRYSLCALFLSGISIIVIKHIIVLIVIIVVLIRFLGLFKTVSPYCNGFNRLIMDT